MIISSPLEFFTSKSTRLSLLVDVILLLSLSRMSWILMSSSNNSLRNPSRMPKLALFLNNLFIAQSNRIKFFIYVLIISRCKYKQLSTMWNSRYYPKHKVAILLIRNTLALPNAKIRLD